MLIKGPIQILLHKSKEEWTEVISRLLFTFVTHKLREHLNFSNTFSYLFQNYDVTSLENINTAIYKTRNTGTGNGMRGMRGMSIPGNTQEDSGECSTRFRGMFNKIPGNAQEDSGECSRRFRGMFQKIPGNVQKDSGECSTRFRGLFQKIPGNAQKDSGECSKRFRGMFEKIPGNAQKDSGECSKRFRGMFEKIPGNVGKDSRECSKRLDDL